jgi:nicotinate-nucleotide pyrophosphorylase (carboxylating)
MTLQPCDYEDILRLALTEDIGGGDITSDTIIPVGQRASARMIAKAEGVICGLPVAQAVFTAVEPGLSVTLLAQDGDIVSAGQAVLEVEGPARGLLAAERVSLNFVQRLSGVASETRKFADAIFGTKAQIIDTRKTTPGMRSLEKYAVRCGGGGNHRMGLYDMVLIKDNHIAVAGGVAAALEAVKERREDVEIEVDTLDQLREALEAGAKFILLDNMTPSMLREAVDITDGRAVLEASGGISLSSVRAVAESGVDRISAGFLTHSAPALDVGLDIFLS